MISVTTSKGGERFINRKKKCTIAPLLMFSNPNIPDSAGMKFMQVLANVLGMSTDEALVTSGTASTGYPPKIFLYDTIIVPWEEIPEIDTLELLIEQGEIDKNLLTKQTGAIKYNCVRALSVKMLHKPFEELLQFTMFKATFDYDHYWKDHKDVDHAGLKITLSKK